MLQTTHPRETTLQKHRVGSSTVRTGSNLPVGNVRNRRRGRNHHPTPKGRFQTSKTPLIWRAPPGPRKKAHTTPFNRFYYIIRHQIWITQLFIFDIKIHIYFNVQFISVRPLGNPKFQGKRECYIMCSTAHGTVHYVSLSVYRHICLQLRASKLLLSSYVLPAE